VAAHGPYPLDPSAPPCHGHQEVDRPVLLLALPYQQVDPPCLELDLPHPHGPAAAVQASWVAHPPVQQQPPLLARHGGHLQQLLETPLRLLLLVAAQG
jgi:hypothetical protein